MSSNGKDKQILFNDAKLSKTAARKFSKRWGIYNLNSKTSRACTVLATIIAEDINTYNYCAEYGATANETCRTDYIEYLANRIEFELKRLGELR